MKGNYLENMSDEEFIELLRPAWEAHEKYLASKNNEDFRPNKENVRRLVEIMECLHELMEEHDLRLRPVKLVPKEQNVSFTVTFDYLWLEGMEYLSAMRAMLNADSV